MGAFAAVAALSYLFSDEQLVCGGDHTLMRTRFSDGMRAQCVEVGMVAHARQAGHHHPEGAAARLCRLHRILGVQVQAVQVGQYCQHRFAATRDCHRTRFRLFRELLRQPHQTIAGFTH